MIAFISVGFFSFLFVGLYRQLALNKRWLDLPNQRSSHTVITPRGAGIIFALLISSAAIWTLRHQSSLFLSFLIGLGVAFTGWRDDIRGLSTRIRLVLYIAAAAATIILFVDPHRMLHENAVPMMLIYGVIAAVGLVWLINLYNFMDGINGLAAFEAIFVLLGVSWLARDTPYGQIFSPIHLLGSAALVGFLYWNFPAGKVFMGDAGSAFLGFFLGLLMLWSLKLQGPPLSIWLILLAAFITDTCYTLVVRFATGQKWHTAHRLHAYQRLTTRLKNNHTRTTALLMAVNLSWLLPLAWLVQTHVISQVSGLALAYVPLLTACYWLKAGIPLRGGL